MIAEKGKLLIVRQNIKQNKNGKSKKEDSFILSLLIAENRLLSVCAQKETTAGQEVGNIYIGKIQNVVQHIEAAFVEVQKGVIGFIPLKNCRKAKILNRNQDDRVLVGDEILVQVTKEAAKKKAPMLTTEISLKGNYCICNYGTGRINLSQKLNKETKKKIKQYLAQCDIEDMSNRKIGFIIRTNAGELEDYAPLWSEMQDLQNKLESIILHAGQRTCYTCMYQAPEPYLNYIQDMYQDQYDEIITDCPDIYEHILEFLPEYKDGIRLYQDPMISLSNLYGVSAKLEMATEKQVWLKSGAYLVIEATEALTAIDVNTGRYMGKKDSSETFRLINREAAEEIALQLRLRNISGIIIVDFINMEDPDLQEELILYMKELVAKDAIRTNIVDITPLGLVEITRKKMNKPLWEQLS